VEYYSKFKTEFKLENWFFLLNAVHRNYICKLRTSNKKNPIEWVFLGMKDYAIFVIDALEMNSIIFFVLSFWRRSEISRCQIILLAVLVKQKSLQCWK
jgi:CTP:phosphocholine cytidylyltransferase-like protein